MDAYGQESNCTTWKLAPMNLAIRDFSLSASNGETPAQITRQQSGTIAHVDDLNILSFLDILRDLVLLDDRQVFFATANARIADLFYRKFDCLGTDFKNIPLNR